MIDFRQKYVFKKLYDRIYRTTEVMLLSKTKWFIKCYATRAPLEQKENAHILLSAIDETTAACLIPSLHVHTSWKQHANNGIGITIISGSVQLG